MKTYRASIYLDITAADEKEAKETLGKIVDHLTYSDAPGLPREYCNAYAGGAALWIPGDLLGNAARCKNI